MPDWITLERVEEEVAIVEKDDGTTVELSLSNLPVGVKEQDVLLEGEEGYRIDIAETERRRNKNRDLFSDLMEK